MRMGILNKRQKSRPKNPVLQTTDAQQEAAAKQVGTGVSGNVIEAVFAPKIKKISTLQAELHAGEVLAYEEAIQSFSNETIVDDVDGSSDADTGATNTPDVPTINPYLFGSVEAREEVLTILSETSSHFTTVKKAGDPKWKIHANAAKFERLLDEKYGPFRPFISKHPEIEVFIRNTQRKYSRGEFSPFRQDGGPIDKKTSIIILFIMHRNGVKTENLVLATLFFLVGLQPWALVLLIILGRQILEGRKKKKVAGWYADGVKTVKPYYADASDEKAKHDILLKPVGTPLSDDYFREKEKEGDETYDTLLVGSGPSTLYTAALLSRTGRTVLVLSPLDDASGCHTLGQSGSSDRIKQYAGVPFDVDANNVAHTSRQQRLIAPALCTESDAQGGIRFSQIGTKADGFTSDILSIPGMGVDRITDTQPFILNAGGINNIAMDAATLLGDGLTDDEGVGSSTSAAYLTACAGMNATASEFYLKTILPDSISNVMKESSYKEASIRYASSFLDQVLPLNAHVRSLMAGIGLKGENLPPSKASMAAHVTNICAQASQEGFTYPVGGPRALCHAFESVIKQNGGKVVTGAPIKEFLFDEDKNAKGNNQTKGKESEEKKAFDGADPNKPRCYGVSLPDGRTISVGKEEDSCVLSMLGFISTFIFHMPDDVRSKFGIPAGLPVLSERRPLLHILVGLHGSAEDLSITGADWYRLPNASLAVDEKDATTGQVRPGVIGSQLVDNDAKEEKAADGEEEGSGEEKRRGKTKKIASLSSNLNKKPRQNKFDVGISWMKVSFPSAKDPSWKERHGNISTCVVTVEADDDFVQMFDSSPKIFAHKKVGSGEYSRLTEKISKDLLTNFPQLEGKIDFCQVVGPTRKGLSQTPLKYAAKGIRPESPYPGLFLGGFDLTVGDSFSASMVGGWIAANAVLKYSFIDLLYLEKNITNDLSNFIKSPKASGIEDTAVPFKENSDSEEMPAAEISKEE